MPDDEKTGTDEEEDLSATLNTGGEEDKEGAAAKDVDNKDDAAGEEGDKDAEGEGDDKDATSGLTDEQVAAARKDPRVVDGVLADRPSALDELLKDAVDDRDKERETEAARAKQKATVEEAIEAYRNGDKDQLADLAIQGYERAQQAAEAEGQISAAVQDELTAVIAAEYGDQIRAMKPEDVQELDRMPLKEAIKVLNEARVESARAEASGDVDAAEKAARNAATGAAARDDDVGLHGGGTSKEGDAGDDNIGALVRQGIDLEADVEE